MGLLSLCLCFLCRSKLLLLFLFVIAARFRDRLVAVKFYALKYSTRYFA